MQCYKKQGCEMCSCVSDGKTINPEKYAEHQQNLSLSYWFLSFESSQPGMERRLCRGALCRKCDDIYCESVITLPAGMESSEFNLCVYTALHRQMDQFRRSYLLIDGALQETFIDLFERSEKDLAALWLYKHLGCDGTPEWMEPYREYLNHEKESE